MADVQSTSRHPIAATREPKRYRLRDSIKTSVFILGSAAIVLIAVRNSLTWQLQRLWGASGETWQSIWTDIHDYFGGDELWIGFALPLIWSTTIFWLLNIPFMFIDLLGVPAWALKFKTQPEQHATGADYIKAMKNVFWNQTVVGIPFGFFVYNMLKFRGCSMGIELPTFPWVVWELFVFALCEELGFYYGHRLGHHPKLYKHVHKKHHEFIAPISVASLYCTWMEMVVCNMIPITLGPIICGSHITTAMLWYLIGISSITIAHCGYHLPFLPSPEAHDYHHLKFNNNFGTLGVLDRLHGTDAQFRQSVYFERHIVLTSFTPVSELFPDQKKQSASD